MTVTRFTIILVLLALISASVNADIYMHNPRGSNNRNCERAGNAQNQNRLFNSQNNANGGYACPRPQGGKSEIEDQPAYAGKKMYYYEGSLLPVQFTLQHACGGPTDSCQVVLQYACQDTMPGSRDGIPTVYDPNNQNGGNSAAVTSIKDAADADITANPSFYGQHEIKDYYNKCQTRRRNAGLWLADQNRDINANAMNTRQTAGTTYGYECMEEREYYPYWHPSPWKDIAVYTTNTSYCPFYQANSENVKGRGECLEQDDSPSVYNNPTECTANSKKWVVRDSFKLDPPECLNAGVIQSRENHLGNAGPGGFGNDFATYWWKIPAVPGGDTSIDGCVLRLRYNISSAEVQFNETTAAQNKGNSPIKQDPVRDIGAGFPMEMAVNTNQVARTFQDRSYTFKIVKRPTEITLSNKEKVTVPSWARIYNLNVRGKRGNIVSTFPAIEYDFVPNYLSLTGGDFIHFQFVGSDYNPNEAPNSGEGGPGDRTDTANIGVSDNTQSGADRSNFVQVDSLGTLTPKNLTRASFFRVPPYGDIDQVFAARLAFLDQDTSVCQTTTQLQTQTPNNNNQENAQRDARNCGKLNAQKHPYIDFGLFPVNTNGRFYFMSTRNNNFSNRRQVMQIDVQGAAFAGASTVAGSALAIAVSVIAVLLLVF